MIDAMDSAEIEEHLAQNIVVAEGLKIQGSSAIQIGDLAICGAVPFEAMQFGMSGRGRGLRRPGPP